MHCKLSKYIAAFDYADKIFIVLSAYFGTLSISCWNSCWLRRCFFDCRVFSNNRNSKETIKRDKEKKEKTL